MGKYLTQVEGSFIEECLMLHLTKPAVIFDAGGGTGRFAIPLYRNGYRVIVEETNPLPLKLLLNREPAIPLILLDSKAKLFPIKESSVDCVLCMEVPSLIESEWFFCECNRILKQNGIIIFTIYNRHSYKGFYKKFVLKEDFGKHPWQKFNYASSFQQIKLRLKNAGFELTRAKGYNWLPASYASNTKLTPYFAAIERLLCLGLLLSLSPWIITQARKIK
jgi:SAM-dependent methyltransferase